MKDAGDNIRGNICPGLFSSQRRRALDSKPVNIERGIGERPAPLSSQAATRCVAYFPVHDEQVWLVSLAVKGDMARIIGWI